MDSSNPYSVQGTAAIAAIITFVILFTIFGNILVIIAVLTSRSLKAPQNLFLVSLAAADILVATLIIPFSLANELMGYWYFEKTWCEIYLALDVLFCTSSIVHLCAISLDRYWSVSQAIEYNSKRTPRRIKCIILIVWTIAAFISFPPLIYKGNKLENPDGKPLCKLNEETWYILSSSICSFFAPCVIMILVYLRIYFIAKRRNRKIPRGKRSWEGAPPGDVLPHNIQKPQLQDQKALGEHNGHEASIQGEGQHTAPGQLVPSTSPPGQQSTCQPNGQNLTMSQALQAEKKGPPYDSPAGVHKPKQSSICAPFPLRALDTVAIAGGEVALVRGERDPSLTLAKRKSHLNREKRFTFVLAVVIGVFVLCWFPFFFTYSLGAVCPELCQIPNGLFQFFFWIGYCNSSLNPVIYTIFNQDFRKAFRRILCRQWTATAW